MARPERYVVPKELKVEVPKAAISDVAGLTWKELLAFAESAGWQTKTTDQWLWCAPDHALFREGTGTMRGVPVMHFQNW